MNNANRHTLCWIIFPESMIGMMKVKNLSGISDNKVTNEYTSWRLIGSKKEKKFNTYSWGECSNDAEVGAHVQKVGLSGTLFIFVFLVMQVKNVE